MSENTRASRFVTAHHQINENIIKEAEFNLSSMMVSAVAESLPATIAFAPIIKHDKPIIPDLQPLSPPLPPDAPATILQNN